MEPQTLAVLLPKWQGEDCVVTFADGDLYEIKDLDIQGYYEDRFEICVRFDKCLRPSVVQREAVANGYLKTEGVSWTSVKPHTPLGKRYLIEEIESVFDRTKNYCVYERGSI
jgi:hypothetical protein